MRRTRSTRDLTIFGIVFAVILFWIVDKVCFQVRVDHARGMSIDAISNRLFTDIISRPLHFSLYRTDLLAATASLVALGLIVLYNAGWRKERNGEEHGSASWGTAKDIRSFMDRKTAKNIQFTQTEGLSIDTHQTQRNINAFIIGGSGTGKTRFFIMPNLRRALTSYAVTDPKGEIMRDYGLELASRGYQVRCLNLIDFAQSNHFNPMKYFNREDPEVSILRLTENLINNTSGAAAKESSDSFWVSSERALLNALIAFVYFAEEDPSLPMVIDLVGRMGASEQDENKRFDVDLMFESAKHMVASYLKDPDQFDDDATRIIQGLEFAIKEYTPFTQGAGETKKSIIISLGNRLAPMQVGNVRAMLSDDDIDLGRLGKEKTVLFLELSDTDRTFSFLASIFYQCLFEENIYIADHSPEGHVQVPIQCLLDEFANIGKIPDFEQRISTFRSRWISACIVMQSYSQGKAMYKEQWDTIVGNCDSILYLGSNDNTTNEWLSKRLGSGTIDVREDSQSYGMSGSSTKSWHKVKRELMTPDELALIRSDECVYTLRGVRPFLSKKINPSTFVYEAKRS
ncbi:VirD4-like conjugal transfer protein, CD1115 family [Bifidobacterium tibiigranuli]|jgi:type IV secretion system protein VirD4|uniref:VirD4-like conjugal transfer protein, CD1115 family n=1 Tax=Bifidobacterium tibiigranuli TaxID=2172043 RepID=UPI002356499C|nr:type IV secretory system conjugative DNA transfer family protein [Bifidobacterium tibiigranuli]MCH3975494.1 type IV secretory system conjugative DNA transfer family protein [Bifidobacterium tibiigranuli]MCH4204147.1 type IV secretory system conjugative DNA transfer family protein [Bifidobacterium tibiigranuli]MCH4274656.1 type IV secretory system conjugative DNA transfer family protein [Bifidobacterium tibiigranuli]MCI1649390.1 type IV secretory system conjugative DNA transfer family protein